VEAASNTGEDRAILREQNISVETAITHSSSPKKEIVRYAREIHPTC